MTCNPSGGYIYELRRQFHVWYSSHCRNVYVMCTTCVPAGLECYCDMRCRWMPPDSTRPALSTGNPWRSTFVVIPDMSSLLDLWLRPIDFISTLLSGKRVCRRPTVKFPSRFICVWTGLTRVIYFRRTVLTCAFNCWKDVGEWQGVDKYCC